MNRDDALTFSQRHGYEDVPGRLQLEELPWAARVGIWNILYAHLDESQKSTLSGYVVGPPWDGVLRAVHLDHDKMRLDKLEDGFERWRHHLSERVLKFPFNRVFDLVEFIMRHDDCPQEFIVKMAGAFSDCQLAYTIDSDPPPSILPATTPEEGEQLKRNLNELQAAGLVRSATHLRKASKHINDGEGADGVRESINAVESVARQIDPATSHTLGAALNSLEKKGLLQHHALKDALSKLYGYASDEEGVRHALVFQDKPNVTIDEAVFMLGACASFASYLWRKHQAANTP